MIELKNQDWHIQLDVQFGSCFHLAKYKEFDVFRSYSGSTQSEFTPYLSGHFPLLPFSNRIKNGVFKFKDKTVSLPVNAPGQKHALHGYGWIGVWEVEHHTNNVCDLIFRHKASDWPWHFEARQNISVHENSLRMELSLRNLDDTPMPSGLGFHPYFNNPATAKLSFRSQNLWIPDPETLPLHKISTPKNMDFEHGLQLRNLTLDHCFTDVSPHYSIIWEDEPNIIDIRTSENLKWAAIYIAHEDNCFCVEPISHAHNALNMDDPTSNGVVTLEPGESQSCWAEFSVIR